MTKKTELWVAGIDPSLAATGVSLSWKDNFTVKSKHAEGDDRLRLLYAKIKSELIGVDFVVIEDLPVNAKSAGLTGMSQGAVRMALRDLNIPYAKLPPSTLKKAAIGKGNASKVDLRKGLEDLEVIGDIDINIKDDNQVDALFLRECGRSLLGYSTLLSMPEALDKYATAPPVVEVLANAER